MVNSQVVREINNALKIDERVSTTPNAIPVIEVGLKGSKACNIVESIEVENAASTTIYTTPENQDFYLTFASLHVQNAAAAGQSQVVFLSVVINSVRKNILVCRHIANTNASSRGPAIFVCGNHPIKVDRNTTITATMDSPTAQDFIGATIAGYTDEML